MNLSRRLFLAAPAALTSLNASSTQEQAAAAPLHGEARARRAFQIRRTCALLQSEEPDPGHLTNGDEENVPNYAAMFAKTLPHNDLGEPDPRAYEAMLQALATGDPDDVDNIPAGSTGKLVNPLASFAYELEGIDGHKAPCPPPPAFASAEQAGDMAELYWMALLRDVPFREYAASSQVQAACRELSTFAAMQAPRLSGGITPETLFRHTTPGDLQGPYISQFLHKDIPFGSYVLPQRYNSLASGRDHMKDYGEFLSLQRGNRPAERAVWDSTPRYLRSGRDLATYVWQDFSYQAFLNAGLILHGWGLSALTPTNPYRRSTRVAPFSSFGSPMTLDLVARAANAALHACWCQKWLVHRKIRPEAFSARVHHHMQKRAQYPIHSSLLGSAVLEETVRANGSYLLSQAYPEGSPAHPSYAAGHAAIAGACVSVLKALFDENAAVPDPVLPTSDGLQLEAYIGQPLTIGGELNKLASNIGYGRHFAGIHYRSDARESMLLGEAVGISILRDYVRTIPEQFPGFQLTKFDGDLIYISA